MLQSNKYACECMGGENYQSWEKIIVDELTAFMGFMLLMGIVRLPSTHDRNRFFEIQRYIHLATN